MNESFQEIFGRRNQSAIWVCLQEGNNGPSPCRLLLNKGQIVFVFSLRGSFELSRPAVGTRTEDQQTMAIFDVRSESVTLRTDSESQLLVVGFDKKLLAGLLDTFRPGLREEVRSIVFSGDIEEAVNLSYPDLILSRLVPAFQNPPVSGAARSFWFESQVKELIALVCFHAEQKTEEFFCSRQKRLSLDRVSKTRKYLKLHLDESPDLNRIAAHVGCSSYYLSRTFSSVTGMTISQYLRRLRVERAAELLLSGRYSVSEVAVEVGYSSQSHFSKALQQEKGCLPSKYDAA